MGGGEGWDRGGSVAVIVYKIHIGLEILQILSTNPSFFLSSY